MHKYLQRKAGGSQTRAVEPSIDSLRLPEQPLRSLRGSVATKNGQGAESFGFYSTRASRAGTIQQRGAISLGRSNTLISLGSDAILASEVEERFGEKETTVCHACGKLLEFFKE